MYISSPVRSIASIYRERERERESERTNDRLSVVTGVFFFFVSFPEDLYFTSHVVTRLTRVEKKKSAGKRPERVRSHRTPVNSSGYVLISRAYARTLRGFTLPRTNKKNTSIREIEKESCIFMEKNVASCTRYIRSVYIYIYIMYYFCITRNVYTANSDEIVRPIGDKYL